MLKEIQIESSQYFSVSVFQLFSISRKIGHPIFLALQNRLGFDFQLRLRKPIPFHVEFLIKLGRE